MGSAQCCEGLHSYETKNYLGKIIDALSEDLHPDPLYHPDVFDGPTTTYKLFKDYAVQNDVSYTAIFPFVE